MAIGAVFYRSPQGSGSLPDAAVSWLVDRVGLGDMTIWGVSFVSTVPERVLLFFICSLALGAAFFFARRLSSSILRWLLPIVATFAAFLALYIVFPTSSALIKALCLSVSAGIMQLPWWIRRRRGEANGAARITGLLSTVILVPALAVLLLNGWSLGNLARRLHTDRAVRQIAAIDLNGLEVDAEQNLLYANGHGTNHLLVYNLRALDQPPQESKVETGFAQGFTYNRLAQELYIFNAQNRNLLVLDAKTLALKKSVPGLNLSEGDCFIEVGTDSDSIIVASEAGYPARQPGLNDGPGSSPIIVLDRRTGTISYNLQWCEGFCNPGHILLQDKSRLLYMGFIDGVLAYDIGTRHVAARTQRGYRWIGDHLTLAPNRNEVLYPSPLHSSVLRFNAQNLHFQGSIPTVFGVRSLAIDPVRNLLLSASGFTNMLDVIDLQSTKRVAKYYVAPWLRTIAIDAKAGTAYVSSVGGLFRVDYTAQL